MASSNATRHKVLDNASLKEGSMQEVKIGDSPILLSKVGGQVYATGAKCTHYGAGLSKGVLTSDGRVVCPWHGACFNIKTGDIEDAPALDALASYKVDIENDSIYVTAAEQEIKSGRRGVCKSAKSASGKPGTVIIGGGASALAAAEALRQLDYTESIIMFTKEGNVPIDRTKLSKALVTDASKIQLRSQEELGELNVQLRHEGVASVDKKNSSIKLENGESVPYAKLILAPGAYPSLLPIDGAKLDGVFLLRNIAHAQAIDKAVGDGKDKHIVILGGSFIGMEAATALVSRGASVTVVEPNFPMKPVLGQKIGERLVELHKSKGVKFVIGQGSVKTIKPHEKELGKIGSVLLDNGDTLPADVLIMAVGVKPATQFLKDSFDVQKDGGIDVDQYMVVKGESNIYAIGDIARFTHPGTDTYGRIEHWNVAENLGRTAAHHLAGKGVKHDKVPYFWSAQQGNQLRYCGHATDYDDVLFQGSLQDLKFSAYYCKGETILAVASIGADPIVSHASELFRLGKMPKASYIKEDKSILEIAL